MAVREHPVRDWTYKGAQRRLQRAARSQLPLHTATVKLDSRGNRIIDCGCGWTGNGLGWGEHLDHVLSRALHD